MMLVFNQIWDFADLLFALMLITSGVAVWLFQKHKFIEKTLQQQHQAEIEKQEAVHTEKLLSLTAQLDSARSSLQEHQNDMTELEQTIEHLNTQQSDINQQLATWKERAQQYQGQFEQSQQEQQKLVVKNEQLISEQKQTELSLSTLQESFAQQQNHHEEKLALLQDNKEQLLKEFELLSQKVLDQKAKHLNDNSKNELNAILNPFKEQIAGLRSRVDQVHSEDTKQRSALETQLQQLQHLNQQMSREAQALTTALKGDRKAQGNWGELVLETVLEKSGLREGAEYQREQVSRDANDKLYRPDVIIHLPDHKHIIIDSKVSLLAYTRSIESDDQQEKNAHLKQHVESVRQHIRSLSEKAYQQLNNINSPDFVFLFMPIEPAFMAAFQQDETLFNDAFEKRIVVVTPTTLLATLRTVASLWSIERRNKSTEKLADQAAKVYDKLVIIVERMEALGKQINTVQGTWDSAMTSLKSGRGNIISQADTFRKLGVRVKKELAKSMVEEANAENQFYLDQATGQDKQATGQDKQVAGQENQEGKNKPSSKSSKTEEENAHNIDHEQGSLL